MSGERNPYSVHMVIRALANGQIPIVSTGGGAFVDMGTTIRRTLGAGNEGAEPQYIVYVPSLAGPGWRVTLNAVYDESGRVKACIADRLARGDWCLPAGMDKNKFINDIAGRSRANLQFAERVCAMAMSTHTYPYLSSNEFPHALKALSGLEVPAVSNNPMTEMLTVRQTRLLAYIYDSTGRIQHVGHSTVVYNQHGECVSLSDVLDLQKYCGLKFPAIMCSLGAAGSKKPYTFVYLQEDLAVVSNTHITLDAGCHNPVCTRQIVAALRRGDKSLVLPLSSGGTCEYDLTRVTSAQCTVTYKDVFCL